MDKKPQRIESLIVNDEGETPALLDLATGRILLTNRVGQRIVELADGSLTTDEIVSTLADDFEGTEEFDVKSQVEQFLEEMAAKGLFVWVVPSEINL